MENTCALSNTNRELKAVAGRDYQLIGMSLFVMTGLLLGLLALAACIAGEKGSIGSSAPQLVAGLVALLVLLNAYVISQKRTLHRATEALIQKVASEAILRKYSFMDPDTQLFTREYLDFALSDEIMNVHRFGTELTLIMVRVKTNGYAPDQQDVIQGARILKSTFRGSDTLVRYNERTFVVLLPDTAEHNAKAALQRLARKTEQWNINGSSAFELILTYEMRAYVPGEQALECIGALESQFRIRRDVATLPNVSRPPLTAAPAPMVN